MAGSLNATDPHISKGCCPKRFRGKGKPQARDRRYAQKGDRSARSAGRLEGGVRDLNDGLGYVLSYGPLQGSRVVSSRRDLIGTLNKV